MTVLLPTQSSLSAGPLAYHVIQFFKQTSSLFHRTYSKKISENLLVRMVCVSCNSPISTWNSCNTGETLLWGEGGVICGPLHTYSDTNCNWCCTCSPPPGAGKKAAARTGTEESCWLPRSDTEQAMRATTNQPILPFNNPFCRFSCNWPTHLMLQWSVVTPAEGRLAGQGCASRQRLRAATAGFCSRVLLLSKRTTNLGMVKILSENDSQVRSTELCILTYSFSAKLG